MLNLTKELINNVVAISEKAGEVILDIYHKPNINIDLKDDQSPLTEADLSSHNLIVNKLGELTPNIPILSEEASEISFKERSKWDLYWLIDPLDGTKEFVKKNGEFTVNIALIENNIPIFGVIYVPVTKEKYWGSNKFGSFYASRNRNVEKLNVSKKSDKKLRIVTSRSHINDDLESLLNQIEDYELVSKGSSLKFCLIASGDADIYPRFGLTSEWDTAAGEAIVKFAGGHIVTIDNSVMKYNSKISLLNPYFIVASNKEVCESFLHFIKKKISN